MGLTSMNNKHDLHHSRFDVWAIWENYETALRLKPSANYQKSLATEKIHLQES